MRLPLGYIENLQGRRKVEASGRAGGGQRGGAGRKGAGMLRILALEGGYRRVVSSRLASPT